MGVLKFSHFLYGFHIVPAAQFLPVLAPGFALIVASEWLALGIIQQGIDSHLQDRN
jgi:hypothetical protein